MIKPPPYNSESGVNVTVLFLFTNTLLQTVASLAQAPSISAAWDEKAVVVRRVSTVAKYLEVRIRVLPEALASTWRVSSVKPARPGASLVAHGMVEQPGDILNRNYSQKQGSAELFERRVGE
jgi:hypothetical protein